MALLFNRIAGRRLDDVAFVGFVAVLALAPLPDGGEPPRVTGALAAAIAVLLLVLAARGRLRRAFDTGRCALLLSPPALAAVLGIGLAAWRASADAGGLGELHTALVRALVLVGIFFLALFLSATDARARLLLRLLVGFAAGYAAFGFAAGVTEWSDVVAAYRAAATGHLGGPHRSLHAFAVFAGLGLLAAVALLLVSAHEEAARAERRAWAVFAAFFLALVLATGSPGCITAVAIAGIVLLGLAGEPMPGKRPVLGLTGLLVLIAIGRLGLPDGGVAMSRTPAGALAVLLPILALQPACILAMAAWRGRDRDGPVALGLAAASFVAGAALLGEGGEAAAACTYLAALLGIACAHALRTDTQARARPEGEDGVARDGLRASPEESPA